MPRIERDRELARRRKRREKLKKIQAKFAKTANPTEKAELQAKARRMSPFLVLGEQPKQG